MAILRRSRLLGASVVASAAATGVLSTLSNDALFRSAAADTAIATAAGAVAVVAAALVFARFFERRELSDLVLATALALLAVANVAVSVPAAIAYGPDHGELTISTASLLRLLGVVCFAAAPFIGDRGANALVRALPKSRPGRIVGAATLAAVAALAFAALAALGESLARERGSLVAIDVVRVACCAIAAVGFYRRADSEPFAVWLAPAAAAATFAALSDIIVPSLYSPMIGPGEFLRLGAYALILVGTIREIATSERARAVAAALEERRRVAQSLHDGLAQELAFIVMRSRFAAARPDLGGVDEVTAAAERALNESRLAIMALTCLGYERLDIAVGEAARQTAHRLGARVELELEDGIEASADKREAIVRIVVESIVNAVRHGRADEVTVELANGDGIHVRVRDRGHGFSAGASGAKDEGLGFGIKAMRRRAETLGGRLEIESRPSEGTCVAVDLP